MSVNSDWWNSLDMDERARIIVPFVQLQMSNKPWKCEWEHITRQEMDLFIGLVREAHNNKLLKDGK